VGLLFVALILPACSDPGPVDSSTITITVNSMNQSDIDPPGILEKDENISNETGNPWGEFIKAAESECESSPRNFQMISVSLALDVAGSQEVSVLEDVITGGVTVYFASTRGSDADAVRVNVASASSVSGVGPVPLGNLASASDLRVLRERLVGGDFHVGVRANTNRTDNDSFSADIRVIFRTRAHCE